MAIRFIAIGCVVALVGLNATAVPRNPDTDWFSEAGYPIWTNRRLLVGTAPGEGRELRRD